MHNTLTVAADLLSLREVGGWITSSLEAAAEPDIAGLHPKIELALQEICVNIVNYAYGDQPGDHRIRLDFAADELTYTFTTTDTGQPFVPEERPQVDLEEPTVGGYGLFLAEKLCERMEYSRVDDENTWALTFNRSVQVPA